MKKIITLAAALGLAAGVNAQKLSLDYNTFEQGVTSDIAYHTRLLNKLSYVAGPVELSTHLINQTNNFSVDNYYGRNRLMVGKKDGGTKLELDVTKIGKNPLDVKIGLRNTSIPKALGLYGHIEATANTKAANITAIVGKSFGKGFALDFVSDNEIPFSGKPFHYLELQLNKDITKHLYGFARVQSGNFQTPSYMGGLGLRL